MEINEMLRCIREASLQDRLVVFIGAGISKNSGFKLWQEFVREMDSIIKYATDKKEYSSEELLKIPQFLYDKDEKHTEYFNKIEEQYGRTIDETNVIIDTLLQLSPKHIITTNFDQLIEASLNKSEMIDMPIEGNMDRYTRIVKDSDLINAKRNRLFIKMHGDTQNKDHIVLKEEDYLQYSMTHSFIETFIKTLFINHTFLFVGYGVGDYNLKLIMSWVDSIANKYSGEVDRTQHFFINADSVKINKFDNGYFQKRNINVIEYSDLPEKYTKQNIEKVNNEKGKNLQRCCLYLTDNDPTQYEIEYILEKFRAFDNLEYICFDDILNCFELSHFPFYSKIGFILYIESFEKKNSAMNTIYEILTRHNVVDEIQEKVKAVFIKCGILQIKFRNSHERKKDVNIDNTNTTKKIGDYVLNNYYEGLRKLLEDKSKVTDLQLGYICSYLNDEKCIEYFRKLYLKSKYDKNYLMQILLSVNLFHIEGEKFDAIPLKNVLPKEYTKPYKTLIDYIERFNEKYAYASRICANILTKYNKNNPSLVSETFQNREFNVLRTEIYDIVKYFIYNCICITASIKSSIIWGNYYNLIDIYIDTIFKLASSYSNNKLINSKINRQSYEEYKFDSMDIYILVNLIENKRLNYLLKDNNISQLKCYDNQIIKKYILMLSNNISNEIKYYIENDGNFFYANSLKNKLNNCIFLLQKFKFDNIEIISVMEVIKTIILTFLHLLKNEYYMMYTDIFNEITKLLCYISDNVEKSDDLVKDIFEIINFTISEINKSDKNNPNNFILESIVCTNFLLNLSQLIKGRVTIEDVSVIEVVDLTEKIFFKDKFIIIVSIYSICSEQCKLVLKAKVLRNISKLRSIDIYYLLRFNVIENSLQIIERLKNLCDFEKEGIDINDAGDCSKPLHAIARLYETKIIDDLEPFKEYAKFNYFFSFVCFPEAFDYTYFNVGWYSWLSGEKYSRLITGDIKNILKPMFEEEMNNLPDEKFKAIYYSLFYETNVD